MFFYSTSPLVGSDKRHYEQFADGTVKDIEDEIPFEVPEGWAWCRLNELADIARGGSPRPIENYITDTPDGINWIKIGDTAPESKYIESAKEKIKPEGQKHSRFVHEGDFLLTNSMSFGRPYILKINGCIHDGWLVFANIKECVIKDYLYYALSSDYIYASFSMVAAGSTVKNLKSDTVKQVLFPLPPIKTQEKIVESIEESFSQIDILDNEKSDLQTIIKQTKSKILDLAIHGKLVPQDPSDEPAEELLKRIATSDNRPYKKFDNEVPFEIPNSWDWSSMKNIVTINPKNKIDDDTQVSFIPMTLIDSEYKNTHGQEERLWKDIKKGFTHFAENDVAIAKISPCFENRKSVILRNLKNGYGAGTTELYILRPSKVVIPEYILWLVKSDNFINTGVGNFSGVVGQQRLARDIVEDFSVPLPPLAEQRRIVTKIENLFNQLDSIQNELIS